MRNYVDVWAKRYSHWRTPKLEAELAAMQKLMKYRPKDYQDQIEGATKVLVGRRKK